MTEESDANGQEIDPIDQMIFSANLFWQGGATHTLRLDEINALRERQLKGEEVLIGDTSARMLVEQLFKNAGFLMNRLAERLIPVFAEALLHEMGDNPNTYLNPHHEHPIRQNQLTAYGAVADTEAPRDQGLVSGYDKPENPDQPKYQDMKLTELRDELGARNLPQTGNKDDLIRRLEFNDLTGQKVDTS